MFYCTIRALILISTLAIGRTVVRADEMERGPERESKHVLAPDARTHGFSLDRMVSLLALFQTSGNNLKYYPFDQFPFRTRPIQVLYVPNKVNNNFVVYAGTTFYVPLVFVDDSPPSLAIFLLTARELNTISAVSIN